MSGNEHMAREHFTPCRAEGAMGAPHWRDRTPCRPAEAAGTLVLSGHRGRSFPLCYVGGGAAIAGCQRLRGAAEALVAGRFSMEGASAGIVW